MIKTSTKTVKQTTVDVIEQDNGECQIAFSGFECKLSKSDADQEYKVVEVNNTDEEVWDLDDIAMGYASMTELNQEEDDDYIDSFKPIE